MKPAIRKLGTIDCDLVETTPIVFRDRLFRFEYVRAGYSGNRTGESYFRFVDHASGDASAPFARGYHLGNAFVEDDRLYVTGTNVWDGDRVDLFVSGDMESWESRSALNLPGYGIFNTSLCRAEDRYVLMFEVGRPADVAGVPFTARFAVSADLEAWELTPPECTYSKDRYTAPHCLRYLEGYYYNFYLEAHPGPRYDQRVVRSRDLASWEPSPLNPVLEASEEDRRVAHPRLTDEERARIATAANLNNSDIDLCEYAGRVIINYSWGNQQGIEHLAEAGFEGTLREFLLGWFP
ncbi:MAG: glycoside hydrolase family 43 protein [Armatimonadetes bacterium]|nr:glycoside hydrolase family 43 protein [Armatimonadota bacterium]